MKKTTPIRLAVILASIFVLLGSEALSLSIKIKRQAYSPARRVGVTGPNYISTGLRVFAKGMKVYFSGDTTGSGMTTMTWTLVSKPAGSNAALTVWAKDSCWFIGDVVGQYIIKCDIDSGKTAQDTLFASTYVGIGTGTTPSGCGIPCHVAKNPTLISDWQKTGHASQAYRGYTGQLEVDSIGNGQYGKTCVRCHTTGWESVTDNGNFGFLANKLKWDSTWWKSLTPTSVAASSFFIKWKSMTVWNDMTTNYPSLVPLATIGCEQCHGAGADHAASGDKTMIGKTFESGVCLQCHDSPKNHSIGYYWKKSAHATMPTSAGANTRTQCNPCHNGPSLKALQANYEAPDYSNIPFVPSIGCPTCHDPHSAANGPEQLRIVKADTLLNKFVIPTGMGGKGQLCMVCHRSRYNGPDKVLSQSRAYSSVSSMPTAQTEMYFGTNGYDFGQDLSGLMTHAGVDDACVTCHMAPRIMPGGTEARPNHQFSLSDENGNDITTGCKPCHGEISSFEDIRAMDDYDGNGKIESAMTEIKNMLARLKTKLPLRTSDSLPARSTADSVLFGTMKTTDPARYLKTLGAIWNYYNVVNDLSGGVHNAKYSVAILKASFVALSGPSDDVKALNQDVPQTFSLGQNYPNPFNPSTTIAFATPRTGDVRLSVYNSDGRLISTLVNGELLPGNYSAVWNGHDTNGQQVGSGVYFYRMDIVSKGQNLFSSTKKMVFLR